MLDDTKGFLCLKTIPENQCSMTIQVISSHTSLHHWIVTMFHSHPTYPLLNQYSYRKSPNVHWNQVSGAIPIRNHRMQRLPYPLMNFHDFCKHRYIITCMYVCIYVLYIYMYIYIHTYINYIHIAYKPVPCYLNRCIYIKKNYTHT